MSLLRVGIVEDDWFKREQMRTVLDRHDEIEVVLATGQDDLRLVPDDELGQLDLALVEVFDESSPLEVGTDMFSGIAAIERLTALGIRTIAISPHRHHPLVEQRIYQSGAHFLYRRPDLNDPHVLVREVVRPDPDRRPQPVPTEVLCRYGADTAQLGRVVATYERSPLHGRLRESSTHRSLGLPRRTVDGFVRSVRAARVHAPTVPALIRIRERAGWLHVRDQVLRLLGRKDAPPSSLDEHDELWMR